MPPRALQILGLGGPPQDGAASPGSLRREIQTRWRIRLLKPDADRRPRPELP